MEKKGTDIRKTALMVIILCLVPLNWVIFAQDTKPSGDPAHAGQKPQPPVFSALDANHDGVISAAEMANAPAALKTLDKNADGRLTPDEYIPPRPGESGGPGRDGRPSGLSKPDNAGRPGGSGSVDGPEAMNKPTGADGPGGMPRPQNGPAAQSSMQRPPKPPIDLALDVNQDGIISPEEIANATAALKKLDKNNDGQLTPDECLPTRPGRP